MIIGVHDASAQRRLRVIGLMLGLALAGSAGRAEDIPAAEFELGANVTGAGRMEGLGGAASSGRSGAVSLSGLKRRPLAAKGWYWIHGAEAGDFFFTSGQPWPSRLQDYAAQLGLEFYEGTENVAALTLRPGWYFENRPTWRAWDVPIDLTGGLPVTQTLSAVLGFSNARFYHHALPILGVVWTAGARMRVELLYPEPALVLTLGSLSVLRLGGELTGAGFLSDALPVRMPVEYASYRVGAGWSRSWPSGFKLTAAAGVETERSFDFFRGQGRLHGSGAGYFKIGATYSH